MAVAPRTSSSRPCARDAADEPLLVLAGGSNVVIADAGFAGHRRARAARAGSRATATRAATSQAGEPWDALVARCVDDGLQGFECLSGIPGSTGATPIQNVGAYGQEVAETVESVRVLDRATRRGRRRCAPAQCGFGYRAQRLQAPRPPVVLAVALPRCASRATPARCATPSWRARSACRSAAARRWPTCARRCSRCAAARAW